MASRYDAHVSALVSLNISPFHSIILLMRQLYTELVQMQDEASEIYRLINAGGNHYDIGRKMTDAITDKLLSRLTTPVEPSTLDRILKCAETSFEAHPVLKDEMQGISEGISIDIEAMLREISDAAWPTKSVTIVSKSEEGMIAGRNFTAPSSVFVRNMLRLDPNDSYASLGRMAGFFSGTWESISVFGYFVAADILSASQGEGVAAYMVPRMLTEANKTLQSAVEALGHMNVMQKSSFLLLDRERALLVKKEGTSTSLTELDTFPALLVNGEFKGKVDADCADKIRAYLSSHDSGSCLHGEEETIYSLLLNLEKEEVHYTDGAPCSAPFRHIDWPGGYA